MKEPDSIAAASTRTATTRDRITRSLTHLLVIGILFILPEVLSSVGRPIEMPWQLKLGGYGKSVIFILVFYISYYLVLPRGVNQRRPAWRMALCFVLLIAGALALIWLLNHAMEPYFAQAFPGKVKHKCPPPGIPDIVWTLRWHIRDLVMLILTIALSIALKVGDNWQRIRRHTRELEALKREQELVSLKSQLNPHFLFNTLNTIYALIAVDPDKAQSAVHELSSMLRYVLYEDSSRVPLADETHFVRSYVQLMSLRMSSAMTVNFEVAIDPDMEETKVPSLVFVALIGNAFKHGNTGRSGDSISIRITGHDGVISCTTVNAIATPRGNDGNRSRNRTGGIGLQNLRRRIDLIYGHRASLRTSHADGIFRASLIIDTKSS